MPEMPGTFRSKAQPSKRELQNMFDKQRGGSSARGYGSKWQQARRAFLNQHPLCVMCEKENTITAAEVVDHIRPHKGDMKLFWDKNNWQALCKQHHDRDKQKLERTSIK